MKSANRSNALLVELLIVVMFFMLAATVLLEVYATSRRQSAEAGMITEALNEAQNIADQLYTAQDPEAALQEMGFQKQGEAWKRIGGDYAFTVTDDSASTEGGVLRRREVRAESGEKVLVRLPVARYREVRP